MVKQASRFKRRKVEGRIEGLFAGGTLCAEAQVILTAGGRRVVSNAAIPGVAKLDGAHGGGRDRLIDLGDDEYTRGRPHPMIDPSVRDHALRAALANTDIAVILLDLVLGYGAHPDPAAHLAAIVAKRGENSPALVASVVGTESDPQTRSVQVSQLERAGIVVAPSNAQACQLATAIANNVAR